MSESRASLHLLNAYHPYPSCLSLKLEVETKQATAQQLPLILTLGLNEQQKSLLNGHLRFGVKGGHCNLTVENGHIIKPQDRLDDVFELVTASNTAVTWQQVPQTGRFLRRKELISSLATIQVIDHPVVITLTYDVSPSDISIIDVVGLWQPDISPNKQSVLERKLAQFLWKLRLSSHLALLRLTSDSSVPRNVEDNSSHDISSQNLSELHQLINNIYDIKTNNLLELSELAGLDPLKDLAGGNFLANELSAIDLSGANLTQTNFRGANLTDADLSEAVLNYARFSGADLSGAYLENANLQYADFYRGSLALANLIGADLTGANLQDVNLSQANLSRTEVKGAKFGNNIGITGEMKQVLRERGAIFVDNS